MSSQAQSTLPNGPSGEVADSKSGGVYEPVKIPGGSEHPPQPVYNQYQVDGSPRPQLIRIDSRANLQPRLGFPPQLLRQRPPPPGGTPTPFIQRPPLPPRPPGPGQNIFPRPPNGSPINSAPRPLVPGLAVRPPFQRPQGFGVRPQQGLFQQRSLPGAPVRPPFNSYQTPRSNTLDSSELSQNAESPLAQDKNEARNFVAEMEERRRSVTSIGSNEGSDVINGGEKIYSRPESRTETHMKKIEEDESKIVPDPIKNSQENLSASPNIFQPSIRTPSPAAGGGQMAQPKSPVIPDQEINKPVSKPPIPNEEVDLIVGRKSPEKIKKEVQEENANFRKSSETVLEKPKSPLPGKESSVAKKIPSSPKEPERSKSPHPSGAKEENATKPGRKIPDLKIGVKLKLFKSEGDNDSGVDESTQGNDQLSNGTPKKSLKSPSPRPFTTPTKNKSFTRGGKSPNPKTPETPTASTPGGTERKKIPMNKVQVGATPSPNLKVVKSKIGSLQNAAYKPGGGHVKIESRKVDFSTASSRIAAKNDTYVPGGGDKKIQYQKLAWSASSKIGSLDNATHKPKGGDKKIESIKLEFKDRAKPKVGSKDNMKHVPGGGDIKSEPQQEEIKKDIETKKLDIKVQSKIGSLSNVKYKPGGGDKKIFDDKEYLRQISANSNASLDGSQKRTARPQKLDLDSPEVNLISPTQQKVRILEEVQVHEFPSPDSRPSSRISRKGSRRPSTPRPPWRY